MIKVVHIVRAFIAGGAEVSVLNLLKFGLLNATDCKLIILQPALADLECSLPSKHIIKFNVWSKSCIPQFFQMVIWLRIQKPDIIHTHLQTSGMVGVLLRVFGVRAKFVYTEHSSVAWSKLSFLLHGLAYPFHHHIHFVAKAVQQSVHKRQVGFFYRYKSGSVIHNAVPKVEYLRIEKKVIAHDKLIIATVCIFRSEKQLPLMIALMAQLYKKFPNMLKFIIAGDGPSLPDVKKAIEGHEMEDIIMLPGLIPNVPQFCAGIDVFMMTSQIEGLPITLLEAMQQGCVPVVTPVGGINEVPVQEVGMFIDTDHPESLIKFIENMIEMKLTELDDLRKKSRQIVLDHFSIEKQIAELLKLYNKLLNS